MKFREVCSFVQEVFRIQRYLRLKSICTDAKTSTNDYPNHPNQTQSIDTISGYTLLLFGRLWSSIGEGVVRQNTFRSKFICAEDDTTTNKRQTYSHEREANNSRSKYALILVLRGLRVCWGSYDMSNVVVNSNSSVARSIQVQMRIEHIKINGKQSKYFQGTFGWGPRNICICAVVVVGWSIESVGAEVGKITKEHQAHSNRKHMDGWKSF
jgi:hypothetical protein